MRCDEFHHHNSSLLRIVIAQKSTLYHHLYHGYRRKIKTYFIRAILHLIGALGMEVGAARAAPGMNEKKEYNKAYTMQIFLELAFS